MEDIGRVLVIIPTYNERENIESIVGRVRAAVSEADILIADDNSPDGTGKIADGLAADDERVHVLHRAGKEGLGAAYIAGFHWGIEHGFDVLVEIDADGSHQPEELPRLLSALGDADLVIGSRWIRGGTVENWPINREIISRGANLYARIMLGLPVRDSTGGFRAYRATTLQKIDIDGVSSQGYCFQVDLTLRTVRGGLRVTEVPIRFVERTHGASKMSRAIMIEAFQRIAQWGFAYWLGRLTGRGRR
ncbi:polyprenol monophosphomannose synthase [Actinoallomurus sp. NPDC050550]|uniref:polyprenol monophosphomannose synthase n=1 Tax=Actinoallomurus sp. NPDC050550 TaxID=3154937 RepID=UPI00340B2A02